MSDLFRKRIVGFLITGSYVRSRFSHNAAHLLYMVDFLVIV